MECVLVLKLANPYFQKKLESIEVERGKTTSRLLQEMEKTGFQGRKLGEAAQIWEEMLRNRDLTIFTGFAGSMSTTARYSEANFLTGIFLSEGSSNGTQIT